MTNYESPQDPHAPVGLFDAPLDLDRIVAYWRQLPESASDADEEANMREIEREGRRIFDAVRLGASSIENLADDFEYFAQELANIQSLEPDAFELFRKDLLSLEADPDHGRTYAVSLGGDLEHYAEELLWLLRCSRADAFLPTARSIGAHAMVCDARTDPGLVIAIGNARIKSACERAGLSVDQAWDFAMWLSRHEQLLIGVDDSPGDRAAKDLLWQLMAPTGTRPDVVIDRGGASVFVEPGIEFADDVAKDPYDMLSSQSAPCLIIRGRGERVRARFMLAAANWAWDEKDFFKSGFGHAVVCGTLSPLMHAYVLQIKLRRLIPDRVPARITVKHRPVWLKRDGRNEERKHAWHDAMKALGIPIVDGAVVHGNFVPATRTFAEPRLVVRNSIVLELLARTAFEDFAYLELLEELCPDAGKKIRHHGAEPDDHGLEMDDDDEDWDDASDGDECEIEADEPVATMVEIDVAPRIVTPPAMTERVRRLLSSNVLLRQRALPPRATLSDDQVSMIVALLEDGGGSLTIPALERQSGIPNTRLHGMLALLRRLLNVDGSTVLRIDEESSTVVIDLRLLDELFTE